MSPKHTVISEFGTFQSPGEKNMLMTAYPRIHETPNLDWNAEFRNAESRFSQLLVQKLTLDSPKNIISLFMHEERVKFITKSMRTPLFFSSLSQFDMVSFQ